MSTITEKQMPDTKAAEQHLDTVLKSGHKFCSDCIWAVEHMGWLSRINQQHEAFCTNPNARLRSPIDGMDLAQCKFERTRDGMCGLEGRLFEPYPENPKLRELILSKEDKS